MQKRRRSITELARELRSNPTKSEAQLWEVLRNRRLSGYRFLRQKPFIYNQTNQKKHFFIADFYCPEKKFVLELDGSIHKFQQYYDYQRDVVLKNLGLKTLRISNDELDDIEAVKEKILNELK